MSVTFTKLFSSITESSVWMETDHTRLVWITMLAMADKHGRVWASIPGLANRARVPIESAEEAIKCFLSPDKYSRTKDFDGTRIEEIDGGYRLLNYAKYRAIRDEEAIKESKRNYIAARRGVEKQFDSRTDVERCRTDVERCRANAEAEAEAIREREIAPQPPLPEIPPMRRSDYDALCDRVGCPKECAEWLWNTLDARNWTDTTGQIVRRVEPLILNAKTSWQANVAQRGASQKSFAPAKNTKSLLEKLLDEPIR